MMLSILTRLGRRLGKRTTALISLILVATFMAAGWRVFPWPSPAAGQVVFRTESGALADAG
ncbi:MAG: hypothetical protein HQL39_07180, partial [Alphaproteobacteria bacterium]|nr:hypothetical protein [Alphaproteobacteria bacterium]